MNGDGMRVNEQLKGKEVIDNSGMLIGKLKDIDLNLKENKIEAIILGSDNISTRLGLSNEENIISYDIIKEIGDKILLK